VTFNPKVVGSNPTGGIEKYAGVQISGARRVPRRPTGASRRCDAPAHF
jgi:hypothetical protein